MSFVVYYYRPALCFTVCWSDKVLLRISSSDDCSFEVPAKLWLGTSVCLARQGEFAAEDDRQSPGLDLRPWRFQHMEASNSIRFSTGNDGAVRHMTNVGPTVGRADVENAQRAVLE